MSEDTAIVILKKVRCWKLRLIEVDEEWQTGRRYMRISEDDQDSDQDDKLLREIKQIKEGVRTQEELVAI